MKVLVIAPHTDDEVLGCGATIAKRVKENCDVYVCIVTKGCSPLYTEEEWLNDKKECLDAHKTLGIKETFFLDFPATMLETTPRHELNSAISNVINKVEPDEVYIPHRGDMQLDHKLVVDACMVALRPKGKHLVNRIYCYETLSETGWDIPNETNEFIPNVYEDVTSTLDAKIEAMQNYKSQIAEYPNPRSVEGIKALAMYRGSTVNTTYAEAFMLVREVK